MDCYGEENPCCYLHPSEVVVGICSLCLKERLLILAAKQGHHNSLPKEIHRDLTVIRRKPSITLSRIFALRSFLQRLDTCPQEEEHQDDSGESSISSLEEISSRLFGARVRTSGLPKLRSDSFISIKFEDNGRSSWDKSHSVERLEASFKAIGSNQEEEAKESNGGSLVEHSKPMGSLRWKKRIGHLLQMSRWKRSSMAVISHVGLTGKVEAVKGRRSWTRSLTWMTTTSTTD